MRTVEENENSWVEQLDNLDHERQLNQQRVNELEQKMAELLRQLREKEQAEAEAM